MYFSKSQTHYLVLVQTPFSMKVRFNTSPLLSGCSCCSLTLETAYYVGHFEALENNMAIRESAQGGITIIIAKSQLKQRLTQFRSTYIFRYSLFYVQMIRVNHFSIHTFFKSLRIKSLVQQEVNVRKVKPIQFIFVIMSCLSFRGVKDDLARFQPIDVLIPCTTIPLFNQKDCFLKMENLVMFCWGFFF